MEIAKLLSKVDISVTEFFLRCLALPLMAGMILSVIYPLWSRVTQRAAKILLNSDFL